MLTMPRVAGKVKSEGAGNMKRTALIALLAVLPLALSTPATTFSQDPGEPLDGKVVALDAGHGGTELGATYPANAGAAADVYEKDVNLAVVYELREKLMAAGADVVLTREADETIVSRRERVDIAIEKCETQYERKCDALVSVHHNGSTDSSYDGLLVIYNEKRDLPLATATHDALLSGLDYPSPFTDEGLRHGGYGITIYGRLVSVLTEAYYITNEWEAAQYLSGTPTSICDGGGNCRVVLVGLRTIEEATALYDGVIAYFMDGGGEKCPPGKQEQGKC
jgi:N-acetylmuramoyl-L-alanine amidase